MCIDESECENARNGIRPLLRLKEEDWSPHHSRHNATLRWFQRIHSSSYCACGALKPMIVEVKRGMYGVGDHTVGKFKTRLPPDKLTENLMDDTFASTLR